MDRNFHRQEVLYDNYLNEEIQTMFLPFYLVQYYFLLPKYRIYKNFLTFNSSRVDILSSLGFLLPCVLYIRNYINVIQVPMDSVSPLFITLDVFYRCFGYVMTYTLNLVHRKLNVELILNLQRVFRMFKYEQFNRFRSFNMVSWFAIGLLIMLHMMFFYVNLFHTDKGLLQTVLGSVFIYFYSHIICASQIICMIKNQLNLWISELKVVSFMSESTAEYESTFVRIQTLADAEERDRRNEEMKQEWKRLFRIYKTILETYDIYKKIFQAYVLYHCLKTFVYAMNYTNFFIENQNAFGGQIVRNNWEMERVSMIMSIIRDISLNCFVCFSCEAFYTSFDKARFACIEVMTNNKSLEAKRGCKNMLRLHGVMFRKMEAYRLFAIDARLSLALMGTIVSYVFVVIQFTLM